MSSQSNARLCRAVQKHSCIYDHAVANSVTREAYDRAWLEVAKTCEESVDNCKQRWRNIRTTFARSLIGSAKTRKGNRAREHNLHDVLEFLIPHLKDGADGSPFHESDEEAEDVANEVDKKAKVNTEVTSNSEADDGILEDPVIKSGIDELKGVKVGTKVRNESNTEDDKADVSSKRPPSARLKELRKTIDDTKVTETRAVKKTQSLGNTANAEEDVQNMVEDELSKNAQNEKSKVGTFYISTTNSDTGTSHNKKNDDSNELEDTTENEESVTNDESEYECELSESTRPESIVEDPIKTRQCRLKRACKRGLVRKTITQRDLRQRETAGKGVRRSATRLKLLGVATKQLIADTKLARKTANTAPVETQSTRTRTLCIPAQGDTTKVGSPQKKSLKPVIKLTRFDANSSHTFVTQGIQCSLQPTSSDDDFFDTLKPYLNEMNARQKLHFKKKIFESLMEVFDSTSDFPANDQSKAIVPKELSAVSGDELHLVRELVAMVQAAKHTPELNLDLSSGSGGDLANKTTSAEKCAVISPTVAPRSTPTPTQPTPPPPLSLRVTPFNTTTTSASTVSTSSTSTTNSATTSTQSTTTTTSSSPLLHRRVIRKLVKVNELGTPSACNMPSTSSAYIPSKNEILHRRIYRIFPKSGVNNASLENAVNASSVGTFIVPRSIAEATVHKTTTSSPLASTSTSARTSGTATNQKVTPVSGASAPLQGLVGGIVRTARNPTTVRVGARPLTRRFSVCGALQNSETDSKILTTTANAKKPVSSTPKITIAHRCSPANVAARDLFKLPTPFRSSISSVNAIVSPVSTNTTTSRTSPVVSIGVSSERNSAMRTIPLNMGFNNERTAMASPPSSSSNAKVCRDAARSLGTYAEVVAKRNNVGNKRSLATNAEVVSHVVGNKRPLATYAEVVAKRSRNDESTTVTSPPRCSSSTKACRDSSSSLTTYAEVVANRNSSFNRNEEDALGEDMVDMGVVGSDEFDILNIKNEPVDD